VGGRREGTDSGGVDCEERLRTRLSVFGSKDWISGVS
jgi:hypothetical protein